VGWPNRKQRREMRAGVSRQGRRLRRNLGDSGSNWSPAASTKKKDSKKKRRREKRGKKTEQRERKRGEGCKRSNRESEEMNEGKRYKGNIQKWVLRRKNLNNQSKGERGQKSNDKRGYSR